MNPRAVDRMQSVSSGDVKVTILERSRFYGVHRLTIKPASGSFPESLRRDVHGSSGHGKPGWCVFRADRHCSFEVMMAALRLDVAVEICTRHASVF